MKLVSEQDIKMLEEAWNMLNQIPVSGQRSIILMGTAMGNIQEFAKVAQESPNVDDPRETETEDKK